MDGSNGDQIKDRVRLNRKVEKQDTRSLVSITTLSLRICVDVVSHFSSTSRQIRG